MLKIPFFSRLRRDFASPCSGYRSRTLGRLAALCLAFVITLAGDVNLRASGTGLVGYWSFDEGAGTTAADSSGNENTGTLVNGPIWGAGKFSYGLLFDGVDDYVAIPHSDSLSLSQELTVSAWIYNHATSNYLLPDPEYHVIASKGWAPDPGGSWTLAWEKSTNALAFFVRRSSDKAYNYAFVDYGSLTNDWHHVTAVFNNGNISLYLNGFLAAGPVALGTSTMNTNTEEARIGAVLPDQNQWLKSWDGYIDEVQIYNRALTDSEIGALYDSTYSEPTADSTVSDQSAGGKGKPGKGNAPAATPAITPNGGEFSDSISVTLTSATPGASIYYTIDGSEPTESAQSYKGPFVLTSNTLVKAKAFKKKSPSSAAASAWFVKGQKFDFSLSNSGNKAANKGSSAQNTISATLKSGSSRRVSLSASGVPTGATADFSTVSCDPTCSSTLTISTSSSTPGGTYPITVTGTDGEISQSTSFDLTVTDPVVTQPFDFSLTNGGNKAVVAGSSVTNSITASLVSGTKQTVSFAVSGLPLGATASFSPSSCSPNCSSTLTILAGASTAPGTYTVTVTASGGGVTKTTSFSLTVTSPTSTSCPTGQFLAEYYNNMTLSGSPTFTRCESSINYDWGTGGPGNGLGTDNFSVRWTGSFKFNAGTYTFTARADDGIRVWVDGAQIINAWMDQPATTYQASRAVTGGEHVVKVEYYENGGFAVAQVGWQLATPKLTVTWQDNSDNEDNFQVERKSGTGTYGQIAVLPANTSSYVDANLTSGLTYCYRVRAANSYGVSAYSNEACQAVP